MLSTNQAVINSTETVHQPAPMPAPNNDEEANPLLATPPTKASPEAPPDQKHRFAMAKMNRQPQF